MTRLRLRDFLFPQRLLNETDAWDNPFVVHSRRRFSRPSTRIIRGVWTVLVLLIVAHFGEPFPTHLALGAENLRLRGGGSHLIEFLYFPYAFRDGLGLLIVGGFSFFLLRYHLFVNDQSRFIKSVDRCHLEHLLLSRMGRNEYFLHHLLFFCRQYHILVLYAAGTAFGTALVILLGDGDWIRLGFYKTQSLTLFVVLTVWLCGVFQYLVEWRTFVAGSKPWLRAPVSILLSAALAFVISLMTVVIADTEVGTVLIATGAFFLAGSLALTRWAGGLFSVANDIVWNRFVGESSAESRSVPWSFRAFAEFCLGVIVPTPGPVVRLAGLLKSEPLGKLTLAAAYSAILCPVLAFAGYFASTSTYLSLRKSFHQYASDPLPLSLFFAVPTFLLFLILGSDRIKKSVFRRFAIQTGCRAVFVGLAVVIAFEMGFTLPSLAWFLNTAVLYAVALLIWLGACSVTTLFILKRPSLVSPVVWRNTGVVLLPLLVFGIVFILNHIANNIGAILFGWLSGVFLILFLVLVFVFMCWLSFVASTPPVLPGDQ